MDILKHYIDIFNGDDNELYKNDIDNAHSYEWLKEEIPIFECPDKELERAYYFRFWTYRKHIRSTDEGYVITEFLPNVRWAGKYNTINAPFGHQLYEGRWLKNSDKYLVDYIKFFLNHPESSQVYSTWFSYAVMKFISVKGDVKLAKELLPSLIEYYENWEKTHKLKCGMFYSIDGYDAMEYSISGRDEKLERTPGIRPTLNSYLCGDAYAISKLAELVGEVEIAREYAEKFDTLRALINKNLFKDGFYRAYHANVIESLNGVFESECELPPRELLGYIPWMFNIPTDDMEESFPLLMSEDSFYTDFGPATAERSHPKFLYPVNHECLWNGYVWPFATSQTLNALLNAIDNYGMVKYKKLYRDMLIQYARTHNLKREDGKTVSWIDESRHPFTDDWHSRTILRSRENFIERGKDYNHSTFCDNVISGIVGVKTDLNGEIRIEPNIPEDWEYFTLTNLHIMGKVYDISYSREKGLSVIQK